MQQTGFSVQQNVALALLSMQRHSWEQGVAMQAFLELGQMQVVVPMAREAVVRALPDGRAAMLGDLFAVTDPCATGEALTAAAQQTGDPVLHAGADALLEWAVKGAPRNAEGVVYHLTNKPQVWVDSMYMLPPFLASMNYPREAMVQVDGYWRLLFDESAGLMHHIWDDGRQAFDRAAFWGVGNGWALAGLTRMIRLLPPHFEEERGRCQQRARDLIDTLLRHMRADGLFYDVVDDPSTFVETNLAQMLCYSIRRGMTDGWLPRRYETSAVGLREAVLAKVDAQGLVQGVCGAPTFDKPGVAPEGQAFFLLMEAALADDLKKQAQEAAEGRLGGRCGVEKE